MNYLLKNYLFSIRAIHSAASLCGRRGKIPWNIKFPIFPDDVAADKEGGREDLPSIIAKTGIRKVIFAAYDYLKL